MKLHVVTYKTASEESVNGQPQQQRAAWATSGDAASKLATILKGDHAFDKKSIQRFAIEVPTKKEELVEFLNKITAGELHDGIDNAKE